MTKLTTESWVKGNSATHGAFDDRTKALAFT
jgi:hypothetical protein